MIGKMRQRQRAGVRTEFKVNGHLKTEDLIARYIREDMRSGRLNEERLINLEMTCGSKWSLICEV